MAGPPSAAILSGRVEAAPRGDDGRVREEAFPVRAADHPVACELVLAYVLAALKLKEFELRVVGS